MSAPPCKKCGKPCQKYGGIGGYSVCCVACNQKNAQRQRQSRARRVGVDITRPMVFESKIENAYGTVLADLRSKRDLIDMAIKTVKEIITKG